MNIANRLTVLRIILAGVFIVLLFFRGLQYRLLAAAVFALAALTDLYDGYVARKYNLITNLGKFLDPLADKILVMAAFIGFVEMRIIPGWMVVVIIARELLVTGIRVLAATQGSVPAAMQSGKYKTVSQMAAIMMILLFLAARDAGAGSFSLWFARWQPVMERGIYLFMGITVGLTVFSGLACLRANTSVLKRLYHEAF